MSIAVGVGVGISYLPSGVVVGGGATTADQPIKPGLLDGIFLNYKDDANVVNLLYASDTDDYIINYQVKIDGLYLSYTDGVDDYNLLYAGSDGNDYIIDYQEVA